MIISREDMAAHINAGRAERWTHGLGPDHLVLTVARMDGRWFAVLDGENGYQPAPEPVAALLTAWRTALDIAEETVAKAGDEAITAVEAARSS